MKKKLLSFILTICFIMPFALVLTACDGNGDKTTPTDPTHTHTWDTTYSKDGTHHWYACSGENCSEKKDTGAHTYNVDTCSVCGYVNNNLTPATLQSMDTYFSGVKAEYLKDGFVGSDSQTTTFEELLDTQIDVLTQDILYRLAYVYGANSGERNIIVENDNYLKYNSNNYVYNEKKAVVEIDRIMTYDLSGHDTTHKIETNATTKLDVSCQLCYQLAISSHDSRNYFYDNSRINLSGAIEGQNTVLDLDSLNNPSENINGWVNWNYSWDSTYTNVLSIYKNSFKMGIAQILSDETITGVYNETTYNNMLNSIKNLGLNSTQKDKIINFIKTNIIGADLISKDNAIYQYNFSSGSSVIDYNFKRNAPYDDGEGTFTAEQIANSPRLYKGYSIVIPAIVEQALANTFEDTNISLYPKMSRIAYESTTTTTGFATEKEYQTITLMPKADAVTTRLVVKLTGVGSSIGQTIALDYDVVINGATYSGTKNVTLSATEQEVEIDINTITNGSTLGAYNGTTTSHTSGNAFNNNDFDAQGNIANSDGNNYIKLDFNNTNSYSFIVTFGGMYNK